jgi:hypothetical protein
MNQTLETLLLSMIVPATALAVFLLVERQDEDDADTVRVQDEDGVVQQEFKLMPRRKL